MILVFSVSHVYFLLSEEPSSASASYPPMNLYTADVTQQAYIQEFIDACNKTRTGTLSDQNSICLLYVQFILASCLLSPQYRGARHLHRLHRFLQVPLIYHTRLHLNLL